MVEILVLEMSHLVTENPRQVRKVIKKVLDTAIGLMRGLGSLTTEKVIIVPIMIMYMTRIPIRNAFGKLVLVSVRSKNSLSRDFWRVSYSMNPIL